MNIQQRLRRLEEKIGVRIPLNESPQRIKELIKPWFNKEYTVDSEGFYSTKGDVIIENWKGKQLPIKFKYVDGNFHCTQLGLETLEDCPEIVGGDFVCLTNNLTSLKGAPETVGGNFYCSDTNLTSLEGAPKIVGGDFICSHNKLTSLEGAPETVGGI